MTASKVSRDEFADFQSVMELLDRKLRHLAIMQIELSKSMLPQQQVSISSQSTMENANAKQLRLELLVRQA
jgi:hypothetical protein